jgi:hypothetical protein
MGQWFFRKKSKGEVERDPGWDEYFTSNRSTEESLVREAIQNSLDAHANSESLESKSQPARVRIYYSGKTKALKKSLYSKYLAEAKEHYLAEDCKIGMIPDGDCPYVVIEDFNTTGLTGHIDWDYTNSKRKPPYYRFLWSENQSEKGEGTRGRWGIGKVVFPIASKLRSFFAYSIREFDKPREILCGKALLSYHTVNNTRYTADGWWGVKDSGEARPETSADEIADFKKAFNISRTTESGLSVVVPYVKEIDWLEIQRVLVENYMVSFIKGDLNVELENGDGEKVIFDSEHLAEIETFLQNLAKQDPEAKMLLQAFSMICEGLTAPMEFKLNLYDGECPDWQDQIFDDSTISKIREQLDKMEDDGITGRPVTIIVPMRIAEKKLKREKTGEFKVVIRRSVGSSSRPWFYRSGLYINRVRPNSIINFVSVVLIDGVVSDMLNQAEPPSHSEWRMNTGDFKKIYKYPAQHIDFVVKAVRRIVDRIDEVEKGLDRDTLKNIFFVSRQKRLTALTRGKGAGRGHGTGGEEESQNSGVTNGTGVSTPNFEEFAVKPKPYMLYPVKDGVDSGVVIKANGSSFKPFDLRVSFFYETLSGKVKFDENDFSFLKKDSLSVSWEPENLIVEFPAANRIRIKADESAKDFKLTVRGFDVNRDLRVMPYSEDLKEDGDGA